MDKSEILSAIKKKVYYAELPSKIDVSVKDDTLYIIIDADGVHVIIDWDNPVFSLDEKVQANQRKHFNRFLLRVVWFAEDYS